MNSLRGLEEAVRVTVEAFRVLLEAMRVIIEAVRKIIEDVRLFVETGRVLRSSANKSIPIDPRLWNNFLRSLFHPVKFRVIVCFASIMRSFGLPCGHPNTLYLRLAARCTLFILFLIISLQTILTDSLPSLLVCISSFFFFISV